MNEKILEKYQESYDTNPFLVQKVCKNLNFDFLKLNNWEFASNGTDTLQNVVFVKMFSIFWKNIFLMKKSFLIKKS